MRAAIYVSRTTFQFISPNFDWPFFIHPSEVAGKVLCKLFLSWNPWLVSI